MFQPKSLKSKTIAQAEMRNINRSAVLEYLRIIKSTSRTEIANQLQISLPTAMRIIDQLLEEGLVQYTGEKETGKGRSRELLSLDTPNNLVIGLDLGGANLTGCIATIGGEMLEYFSQPIHWTNAEDNFTQLVDFINLILQRRPPAPKRILGLTIGIPGIIDQQYGVVRLAPGLDWFDFPLLDKLNPLLDLPLTIENDVNLAVLGEQWFGAAIEIQDAILISIGSGIGAGILLNGTLHRGHRGTSGEVGYLLPGIQYLNQQYPGYGAMENLASEKGILQRAEMFARQFQYAFKEPVTLESIFYAARQKEPWAVAVLSETIDYLCLIVASMAVCFDPEMILLGGRLGEAADLFLEPIRKRLKGVIPDLPSIEEPHLADRAGLFGCVVLTFQKVTDYAHVSNV